MSYSKIHCDQVQKLISKKIVDGLSSENYQEFPGGKIESKFSKDILFRISINVKGTTEISVQTIFSASNKLIENYWLKYLNTSSPLYYENTRILNFILIDISPDYETNEHKQYGNARVIIRTPDDIDEYVTKFVDVYKSDVLPIFMRATDIEWLDQQLNSTIDTKPSDVKILDAREFWFNRIIVAMLAKNPNADLIFEYIVNIVSKAYDTSKSEEHKLLLENFRNVYRDLREDQNL